jgi:plasmid stabilization system protein ParE
MEIVWSDTALATYFKVIDFLFDYWTEKEVATFDENVEALLHRLAFHNHICPESKLYGFRKCVIDEYNAVVYQIANNKVYLVTFLDNRSAHSY